MSKKFVGNVKVIKGKDWEIIKIGVSKEDFDKYQKNGWVNAVLKKSKKGKYYLELDEWTPEKKEASHEPKNRVTMEKEKHVDLSQDLPF
jgi:hypothetical protein